MTVAEDKESWSEELSLRGTQIWYKNKDQLPLTYQYQPPPTRAAGAGIPSC